MSVRTVCHLAAFHHCHISQTAEHDVWPSVVIEFGLISRHEIFLSITGLLVVDRFFIHRRHGVVAGTGTGPSKRAVYNASSIYNDMISGGTVTNSPVYQAWQLRAFVFDRQRADDRTNKSEAAGNAIYLTTEGFPSFTILPATYRSIYRIFRKVNDLARLSGPAVCDIMIQ